jgi:hypothetical protein
MWKIRASAKLEIPYKSLLQQPFRWIAIHACYSEFADLNSICV